MWFVDLPTTEERKEIFKIHLTLVNRQPQKFNLKEMAIASAGFTGAEIKNSISQAMYKAFGSNREFTSKDILTEINITKPLSATKAEDLKVLREWASTRARWASSKKKQVKLKEYENGKVVLYD